MKMESDPNFLTALDTTFFHSGFLRVIDSDFTNATSRIYRLNVFGELLTIHLRWDCNTGVIECDMKSCIKGGDDGSMDYTYDGFGYQQFRFQSTPDTGNEIIQAARQFANHVQSARQVKSLNNIDKKLDQMLQKLTKK